MSQAHTPSTGIESDRPFGVATLCVLTSLGAAGTLVFGLQVLANGRVGVGALAGGIVLVTALVVVGLWNTYTWGWELGVVYYAIGLVLTLASAAMLTGELGEVSWWMVPGPVLSLASMAYLIAVRDAFGRAHDRPPASSR
jgi:hypothetical protein